ncbi:unnamed protein product [Clonostachys rhizophaga]|uniref:TMEM205-like domain-containing protein n=1 Tax=Clonostachys rhizophaga TaxID=160324 RepID=A0A9N9V9Z5_9HYPO|nr:unnamed protein product [Clonostachys rhizophaga]
MAITQSILSVIQSIFCTGPAHLLCFSALLGTELYQSFVITKICFLVLPRKPFTALQARVFPVYFRIQSSLLVLLALTTPSRGLLSLIERKSNWIPLLVGACTAALNLFFYGPRTSRAMFSIDQLGTATAGDRTESSEREPLNQDKAVLRKTFSKNHAASIHFNLITIIATLWYGWGLSTELVT